MCCGSPTGPGLASAGDLSAALIAWRVSLGNGERAAALLGISVGTLRRWEAGSTPAPRHSSRLIEVLGLTASEFAVVRPPDRVHRPETTGLEGSSALAVARAGLGISQAEFARRIPVVQSVASRWECRERRPAHNLLHRIQAVLGVTPEEVTAMFEDYPDDQRSGAGKLPGLRAALDGQGVEVCTLATIACVSVDRADLLADGRAAVTWREAQHIATLLGREATAALADLRRRPPRKRQGLRGIREARGLTQDAVGSQIGVSGSTIGNWERGKSVPTLGQAQGLARLLGIDEAGLLRELGLWRRDQTLIIDQSPDLPTALAELRRNAGLSKAQVARSVGVQHASVARWETSDGRPRPQHLRRLAMLYGLAPLLLVRLLEDNPVSGACSELVNRRVGA